MLALAACGGGSDADEGDGAQGQGSGEDLVVSVASFDPAVGDDQRLLAGLFTPERQLVGHGEVRFDLAHLGDGELTTAEVDQSVTAGFLPVPGMEPDGEAEQPVLLEDTGSGVYGARVDLDRPGVWGLRVVAELGDGTVRSGTARFEVAEEPTVPAVGDAAPRVDNPTVEDVEDGTLPPVALDSRAQEPDDDVPDEHLHRTVVSEAIEQERPVVVMVGTPVYCQSRFCGPLAGVISELATEYDDRADFVLLEVWRDFDASELNESAAAFIQTEAGGHEPWVFLIDADGTIRARWDNVLDVGELEDELGALPELPDDAGAAA